MRSPVFGNEIFDQWLNQKTKEILAKVENEKMSTEDMMILCLKAQVNHFHHMDVEFREEFHVIRKRIDEVDQKFEKRFDRMSNIMMWGFGLILSALLMLTFKPYL